MKEIVFESNCVGGEFHQGVCGSGSVDGLISGCLLIFFPQLCLFVTVLWSFTLIVIEKSIKEFIDTLQNLNRVIQNLRSRL